MMRVEQIPMRATAEGMTLAAGVRHGQGVLLVGAGTALSARLIEQLARRRIDSLPLAVAPAPTSEERTATTARLEERFARVRGQPLMDRLFEPVLRHRLVG